MCNECLAPFSDIAFKRDEGSVFNDADLLFKVVLPVRQTGLSPKAVTNHDMGLVFEDLIRRFAEGSNEPASDDAITLPIQIKL